MHKRNFYIALGGVIVLTYLACSQGTSKSSNGDASGNGETPIDILITATPTPGGSSTTGYTNTIPTTIYQGLTELFARKTYLSQKPLSSLYQGSNLQSELLHYKDVQYGTHIWRVSNSFNAYTIAHNHINRSPWNINGSKIGVTSNRCFPPLWCRENETYGDPHSYMMDTDGDNFVRIAGNNCPNCTLDGTRFRFFSWDRQNPNYTYFAAKDGLYRLDITQLGTFTKVANLTNTDRSKVIYADVAENNVVMVLDDLANNYTVPTGPLFYFVDLTKSLGDSAQVKSYPIAFNISWTGHDLAKENSFHDIYFTRKADNSYTFNYGPIAGVGEYLFFKAPYDGVAANVQLWYADKGAQGIPYHSHPAWGPQGTYTAYFGEQYPYGSNKWGFQIADDSSKAHIKQLSTFSGGHIAWDGYDPNVVCASVSDNGDSKILRAKVDGVANNGELFINTFTGLNSTVPDPYQALARPALSPDSTKVFFHSTMFSKSDEDADGFVGVVRYPLAPNNLRASNAAGLVIQWDVPTQHRETKGYHLYRSINDLQHFVELTTSAQSGLSFSESSIEIGKDYYYGVTSEEWSGLESDSLSNIIKVSYNESVYSIADYPTSAIKQFDKTAPSKVENLVVTKISDGVYKLTWTANPDKDLWYYNIYYSVEGEPDKTVDRLIASVPKTQTSYFDWQARADVPGLYSITAVDRQGNESPVK